MDYTLQEASSISVDIDKLIIEHGDYILRLCYFYTKDRQIAEDILQEVFISVYQNYSRFNHDASEKTWITKIAINKCKSYLRTVWFKRVLPISEIGTGVDEDVEERFFKNERERELIRRITQLQIKYREVILLYYYNELTIKEISTMLGINESTVKTRLKRGREKLKFKLEERCIYE